MELIFVWLLLCVAVCVLAARYNRSVAGWLVLSVLLSPLVGLVLMALGPTTATMSVPCKHRPAQRRMVRGELVPTQEEVGAAYRDARYARDARLHRPAV